MESLSIKKTGKVMLAVALVIFMLVAILGLSIYGHTAATASATAATTITATFSGASAPAHDESTDTEMYYNVAADGSEGSKPLAVNDTFTVTYSFTPAANLIGYKLRLGNTGFAIQSVKVVGDTNGTNGTQKELVGGDYTDVDDVSYVYGDYLVIDGFGSLFDANSEIPSVVVVYKLTEAIACYDNATLGLTGLEYVYGSSAQAINSSVVTIYVRSMTALAISDVGKTYDGDPVNNPTPTFTAFATDKPAIPTPTYTWSSGSAPLNAGDYTVNAATASDTNFEASSTSDAFTIAPKAITITAVDKESIYGGAIAAATYTASPADFLGRDGITVSYGSTYDALTTASAAGEYTIVPSASGSNGETAGTNAYAGIANYSVTPVNGTYTIWRKNVAIPTIYLYNGKTGYEVAAFDLNSTNAANQTVTFNGYAYSFSSANDEASAPVAADGYTITYTNTVEDGATRTNVTAAGYPATMTLNLNSNYYWGAAGSKVAWDATGTNVSNNVYTFVINKAPLTVTVKHDDITYRDAKPTTGFYVSAATELLMSEDITAAAITSGLTQTGFSTTYAQGSPVGSYDVAVTGDALAAIEAYFFNYVVTINGDDTLSVDPYTMNAAASWITYTTGVNGDGEITYDQNPHGIQAVPASYTFTTANVNAEPSPICNVVLSGGDNENGTQTHVSGNEAAVPLTATFSIKTDSSKDDYNNTIAYNYEIGTASVTKDITILRRAATVTAVDKSTTYGSAAPAFTYTHNLISGDNFTTEPTAACAYEAEDESENRVCGDYDIVYSDAEQNDYTFSYVDATLTVNPLAATISWDEDDELNSDEFTWIYDGAAHTIVATVAKAYAHDTVTVSTYGGDASATNYGAYNRTVTALSNSNYTLTGATGTDHDYTIAKRTVTVTVTPNATPLTYNSGMQKVFTAVVENLVTGEDLTFTLTKSGDHDFATANVAYTNGSYNYNAEWADTYTLQFTAIADGESGLASNYQLSASAEASKTIAQYQFTWAAATPAEDVLTWVAPATIQDGDSITFYYSLKLGETEKLASTSALTYTAVATGTYDLSVTITGDRAANYILPAAQHFTAYSLTVNDSLYNNETVGHPHWGAQVAAITKYAFDGQTVSTITPWANAAYDFDGWFVDPTAETPVAINYAIDGANKTFIAKWHAKVINVTYVYRMAEDTADTFANTYKANVATTFYTDLQTIPSITWFSNDGWKVDTAMSTPAGSVLANPAHTTYYAEYTFSVKAGDIEGNSSVTTADAHIYRLQQAGGYDTVVTEVDDIEDAWTEANKFTAGTYDFEFVANKYFLNAVADINGDGAVDLQDIFLIANAVTDSDTYATLVEGEVMNVIQPAAVVVNKKAFEIDTPTAVFVNGTATDAYTYENGTLTLNTALTAGDKLYVIVGGAKYYYEG